MPREANIYVLMGKCYKRLGEIPQALLNFTLANDLHPKPELQTFLLAPLRDEMGAMVLDADEAQQLAAAAAAANGGSTPASTASSSATTVTGQSAQQTPAQIVQQVAGERCCCSFVESLADSIIHASMFATPPIARVEDEDESS